MSCFEVQVLEPNINTIEVETCINGQVTSLDIIQYDIASLEITHCVALLPSDYDTIVSGIVPVKNILSGSGIEVLSNSGEFTIAVTGNFGLTSEEVDDRIGNLLVAGQNILLDYNDSGNLLTISTVGLQPSGNYSQVGHYHNSSDILDFITAVSGLLPNTYDAAVPWTANHTLVDGTRYLAGDLVYENGRLYRANYDNESLPVSNDTYWTDVGPGYRLNIDGRDISNIPYPVTSVNGHVGDVELSTVDLDDFASAVSGLLPSIPSVSGVGYIVSDFSNNAYIISATGLQPSGDYSLIGHNHISADIDDFDTAVSGLIPVKYIISGTDINVTNISGIYTINSTVNTVSEAASLITTVFNKTGSPIPKMSAVYIDGGQGDMPTISLAIATGDTTSAGTYGITYETIPNMSTGKVVVFGVLNNLNTDQFNPTAPQGDVNGHVLYLSPTTSGALTLNKPSAPNHIVAIGTIIRTHQNVGVIEVRVQNGFELEELHNVAISGVTNGQFLQYNGSGLWVPSSSGNFTSLTVNNTGVSLVGHTHTSNDITNFNSSVSGLLPVKNIIGSGNTSVSSNAGTFTISSVGLVSNPSGISGATAITNIVQISQANYDLLGTYDANTLYIING